MDRMALAQLAKTSKGDFGKPREMNYCLYDFTSRSALDKAKQEIMDRDANWDCTIQPQADAPSRFTLTATQSNYSITELNYREDSSFFKQVAEAHGGQFDGWFASN